MIENAQINFYPLPPTEIWKLLGMVERPDSALGLINSSIQPKNFRF